MNTTGTVERVSTYRVQIGTRDYNNYFKFTASPRFYRTFYIGVSIVYGCGTQ